MKKIILSITLLLSAVCSFAQADSTSISNTLNDAGFVLEFLNNPPLWLENAVIITGAVLLAVQTILRRFPTEKSVKIGGILGRILDVLALFPPDNKKGGGTH